MSTAWTERVRVPSGPLVLFAFSLPLLPRPTAGVVGAVLVGAEVALLAFLFAVACAKVTLSPATRRGTHFLILLFLTMTAVHVVKILVIEDWTEISYLGARIAALSVSLLVFLWVRASDAPTDRFIRGFVLGYLFLSVFMIYVGLTGATIFETVRPSRELGFQSPFAKTAGIPRSYGELSILATLALSYLLVKRSTEHRLQWTLAFGLVITSVAVAQSRTGALAALLVIITFVALRVRPSVLVARVLLIVGCLIPVLADFAVRYGSSYSAVSLLVGRDTFENNVYTRIELNRIAARMMTSGDLGDAILGVGRSTWAIASQGVVGAPTELHNHVLATLLFGGVVSGSLFLFTCYLLPLWRLSKLCTGDEDALLLFLAGFGGFFSLQFYEGFFSLTTSLIVGLMWCLTLGLDAPRLRQPVNRMSGSRPSSAGAS